MGATLQNHSEIEFPDPSKLVAHKPITVAVFLITPQGDRPVMAGRSTSTHIRPNGAILQVRPQITRPWPVKRNDEVKLRMSRGTDQPPLVGSGKVSWVRDRAFMPSGLAVSMVGVTFDWDPTEMALEVAAFLVE